MTPTIALQYLLQAAKQHKVMLTKTAQMRLLYLTDLRAHRHGDITSGIEWERADHGPFNRSVNFLSRTIEVSAGSDDPYYDHALAIVAAYARLSNESLGLTVKGTAPMRKAPRRGDILNLDAYSTNDTSAVVTMPLD